jgi:hypothetical protein
LYPYDTSIFVYDKGGRIFAFCPHSDARYYADTGFRTGQTDKAVSGFAAIGNSLFGAGPSLYVSTDNGRHWEHTGQTFPYSVPGIAAIDTILVFPWHGGLQRSTDYGKTWSRVSDYVPESFAVAGSIVYGASATEFFRSNDSGLTWEKTANQGADYVAAIGDDVFVGSVHSSDGGYTWHDHDSLDVWAVTTDGTNVYAAGHKRAAYASTDRGRTWLTIDANGLPGDFNASAICVFDSFVYVGGYDPVSGSGAGLYYRPISEILPKSAVASEHSRPAAKRLDVYPNPFGTSCTVAFTLAAYSDVRVSLFDATGREVRMVYAGALPSGLNTLPIEGTGLPDGTYWCRLVANGTQQLAKLTLKR